MLLLEEDMYGSLMDRRALLARATAVTLGLALPRSAFAAEPRTLRFGHVYEVNTAYHRAALEFARAFAAATQGRYKVDVFPVSQLGNEDALNEALTLGTVDVILTGPAFMAQSYPAIAISDYPFTLRDYDHWKAYVASGLFEELATGYTGVTGIHVIGMMYYGARHVTANKPILQPEDMKGLKIRTPGAPAYQLFPKALGANPTPIAFAEVYLALQQGVVDGQENPLPTIQAKKFYEVQSDISLTGHLINSLCFLASPSMMTTLSTSDRDALLAAAQAASAAASDEVVQAEHDLVGWFRDKGVTVNAVDRQPFIDAVAPALRAPGLPFDAATLDRLTAIGR
jgi:tripartite ATP-independent transporter DctP family solute receptor